MADFNLDARQEVRLENDRLVAFVRPAHGGHVYELDVRHAADERPGHARPPPRGLPRADRRGRRRRRRQDYDGPASILERVVLKQEGLDRLLVYDRHPRKALVDHFYPLDVDPRRPRRPAATSSGATSSTGTYLSKVQRGPGRVALVDGAARAGPTATRSASARRSTLEAGSPTLDVHYVLEDLPDGVPLHFAVEINLAAMAGHADDRYYSDAAGDRLGMLDARLDLPDDRRASSLTDEWLDLAVGLALVAGRRASGASRSRRSARARGASRASTRARP